MNPSSPVTPTSSPPDAAGSAYLLKTPANRHVYPSPPTYEVEEDDAVVGKDEEEKEDAAGSRVLQPAVTKPKVQPGIGAVEVAAKAHGPVHAPGNGFAEDECVEDVQTDGDEISGLVQHEEQDKAAAENGSGLAPHAPPPTLAKAEAACSRRFYFLESRCTPVRFLLLLQTRGRRKLLLLRG